MPSGVFIETVDWGRTGAARSGQIGRVVHEGETKNC